MLAIDQDVLKGQCLSKVKAGRAESVDEGGVPLNPGGLAFEDRASYQVCANAVPHSATMLMNDDNQRLCCILSENGRVFKAFLVDATKNCRSSDGCEEWAVRMVDRGVQQHLRDFMEQLSDYGCVERSLFMLRQRYKLPRLRRL